MLAAASAAPGSFGSEHSESSNHLHAHTSEDDQEAKPSQSEDGYGAHESKGDNDSGENSPTPTDHDDAGSAPRFRRKTIPWTKDEHEKFLLGLQRYKKEDHVPPGKNGEPSVGLGPGIAALIAALVGTRTTRQVRSHAQKFFLRQRQQSPS
eukprot:3882822-Rhodomonas_salina.1